MRIHLCVIIAISIYLIHKKNVKAKEIKKNLGNGEKRPPKKRNRMNLSLNQS